MYRHWQPLELPRFVDLVMSYSFVARLTADQRADLAVAVTDFFRTTAPGSTLRLPYRSHAVQAVSEAEAPPQRPAAEKKPAPTNFLRRFPSKASAGRVETGGQ